MRIARLAVVMAVLGAALAIVLSEPSSAAQCSAIAGGYYGQLMPAGAGCQVHHIISTQSLNATKDVPSPGYPEGHGITRYRGPSIKMDSVIHQDTPNWGTNGQADRDLEKSEILQYGILEAFERAATRFLNAMQIADPTNMAKYQAEVDKARQALNDQLNTLHGGGGGGEDPPDGPIVGATTLVDTVEATTTTTTPAAAGAVAVPATTADGTIQARGTGLGGANAGQEYDLLLADSAQLAQDPQCSHSPVIISTAAVIVDSNGNLPQVTAPLYTRYGETGGEIENGVPSAGSAQVCFALSSNHGSSSTVPTALRIFAAATAPTVSPSSQTVFRPAQARYVVTVPEASAARTLRFCYGDGVCETRVVSPGTHSEAFVFAHTLAFTHTYQQLATIVETGLVGNALTSAFPWHPLADFNCDGTTDISLFRPTTGNWSTQDGITFSYGLIGDIPVPADYGGIGCPYNAVFTPSTGTWHIQPTNRGPDTVVSFGLPGDIGVPGDYDGDGKVDVAVFRPSTGIWYILQSSTGTTLIKYYGLAGDIPAPADFDGDGITDFAVWRPGVGGWYRSSASGKDVSFLGLSGDIPVPADYDGDGNGDRAVYRPSTGAWYIWQSSTNTVPAPVYYGLPGDIPVPGDYNADGKADVAVFRPSTGQWFINGTASRFINGTASTVFGQSSDIPLPILPSVRAILFPNPLRAQGKLSVSAQGGAVSVAQGVGHCDGGACSVPYATYCAAVVFGVTVDHAQVNTVTLSSVTTTDCLGPGQNHLLNNTTYDINVIVTDALSPCVTAVP